MNQPARHPRRRPAPRGAQDNTTRPAATAHQPAPAFQSLLQAMAINEAKPAEAAQGTRWYWELCLHRGQLIAVPTWDNGQQITIGSGEFYPAPAAGWSPEDLGDLWNVSQGQRETQGIMLNRASKVQAFLTTLNHRMVKMGDKTVVAGAPLDVPMAWQATEQNGLRMTYATEMLANQDLVVVEGHTYLLRDRLHEGDTVTIQPIATPALAWALKVGELSPADVQLWATRFADDARMAALPLPEAFRPEIVTDTPVLVVRVQGKGDERTVGLGMVLSVRYGQDELSLRGADIETVARDNGRTAQVKRNRSVERRTLNAIEGTGMAVWPHPFSKKAAFPLGWSIAWLEHQDQTWLAPTPPPSSLAGWFQLAHQLEALGVVVEWDAQLPIVRAQSQQKWTTHVDMPKDAAGAWFEAGIGVDVDGQQVDLTMALLNLLKDPDFPLEAKENEDAMAIWPLRLPLNGPKPSFLDVPVARLRALIAPLRHAERSGNHRVRMPTQLMGEVESWPTAVNVGADLQTLWDRIHEARAFDGKTIRGLKATLRPYQVEGVAWLRFLDDMGWGGVLADDMGLGKTLQLLAHLLDLKMRKRLDKPALIVVPTSLLANWMNEATKFAPSLKVLVLHGDKRDHARAAKANLVLTTYGTLVRDLEALDGIDFSLLACDEAQNLRNRLSQAGQAVRKINADRHLAMTGTPLENHLGELYAQVDFAQPGLLGSPEAFRTRFRTPIEKRQDSEATARLRAVMAPFFLRRLKSQVARDLPEKTETTVKLEMGEQQRTLYETIRAAQAVRVAAAVEEKGVGGASFTVLNALLRMRQACCAPDLIEGGDGVESIKRQYLLERTQSLIEEGRKILVVSSFTEVLDRIAQDLAAVGVRYEVLTGETAPAQRGARVDRFQNGEVDVFLISLKAGGVGLNLTAADTVFHFDPWWNPAAEAQATDRAHRLGQDKPVFVYRLVCENSVEEYITALQERKAGLAEAVLDGMGTGLSGLDQTDLDALFGAGA